MTSNERGTYYNLHEAVILNTPYNGDYQREEGYVTGVISEVVVPGYMYSIALDGYFNRHVDFTVREFKPLFVSTLINTKNLPGDRTQETFEEEGNAKKWQKAHGGTIVRHDRRVTI